MFSQTAYNPKNVTIINQCLIIVVLLIFLTLSRISIIPYLEDASWAVFFLIGFYLRSYIGLPLMMIAAIAIDFAQIAIRGGHQDYYLSPSYFYIIPAYASLWFAGRFFASKYSENLKGLLIFFLSAIVGIIVCHLISSGGYYWMSMNFIELSFTEFITRTLEYLPLALKINLVYLSITAVMHLLVLKLISLKDQYSG